MCGGLFKLLVAAREEGKVPAPDPAFDQEQVSCLTFQGFGSGSAWIRINLSCWIRNSIQNADPDPDTGGQKLSTSAGCSLLRAEGFFCNLDVLYRGLGICKL
jgi:hypothetical protein